MQSSLASPRSPEVSNDFALISDAASQRAHSYEAVAYVTPDLAYPQTKYESDYYYGYQGAHAQLEYVDVRDVAEHYVEYWNDLSNQVTNRRQVGRNGGVGGGAAVNEFWYRFGGKQLAYVGNNGTITTDYVASSSNRTATTPPTGQVNDTDQGYDPINSYDSGSLASIDGYTVQAGDTLSGIAAQLWGDTSLWYKLAEANGLTGDEALIEGTLLNVPPGVLRNTYTASTFTPYDPNDIVGNTTPKGKISNPHSCGVFGQIMIALLAVAIFFATQGTFATMFSGLFSGGAAAGTAVAASGGMAAAGAAAVTTAAVSPLAAIAGGAAAGTLSWEE